MSINRYLPVIIVSVLTACTSNTPVIDKSVAVGAHKSPAGRYSMLQDQGPDTDIDVDRIPDAVPKIEPRTIAGNMSPYVVLGKTYSVQFNTRGFSQTGYASWYGKKFHGERTSNGEIYNMFAMTAAHKTLPIPCYVRVTNLENNKTVILRVNDRGPFHDDRIVDLTYTAAKKLGFQHLGTAKVRLDVINVGEPQAAPIAAFKPVITAKSSPALPTAMVAMNGKNLAQNAKETKNSTATTSSPATTITTAATATKFPSSPMKTGAGDVIVATYLQVGSFSTQAAAQNLQKSLQSSTHYPIVLIPVEGKNLFRVLIGPFVQKSEIQALKQQLEIKKISNPYIVQGLKNT